MVYRAEAECLKKLRATWTVSRLVADELSTMLNNVNPGCFVGASLVNHLMYADDLVLLAPSAAGLSM